MEYSLDFPHTNEILEAIVSSMDLRKDDDVLAILGSGEQALAFAPLVNSVTAVDENHAQFDYAVSRIRALNEFYGVIAFLGEWARLDKYNLGIYFAGKKLEDAKKNAGKISFCLADIFNYPWEQEKFSKAYLSNACRTQEELERIAGKLRQPGLVYIANGDCFTSIKSDLLEIDWNLTGKANRREQVWHPAVLRRRK
ncbi:MAG: hypothetical protein QME12_07550 [Nanoarchaeota archaeon]|nr:hypothetical protein [Nanoarchaeota archaeon]